MINKQPWTTRERALLAALEGACKDLEAGYWRTRTFIDENVPGWVHGDDGPSHPLIRHLAQYRSALSDQPPPDPRDAALRLATQALEMASGTFNAYTVHHAAKMDEVKQAKNQCLRDQMDAAITAIQAATEPARQSPTDPRDEALRLAEAELLRLWTLVPAGRAGVGGVRTIALEDDEVARLRQIVDAIRAAKGGA